ncbi:hypothetical protein LTR85_005980 [Meristemomyces frigidus]|nr:hypothetical protein LTR85_005980 [Meristemomyces frigidus]
MSVAAPSRRLAGRCLFCQNLPIRPRVQHQQRRTAIFGSGKKTDDKPAGQPSAKPNPILEEYQRRNPQAAAPGQQQQARPQAGDIAASSIFEDDRRAQRQQEQYAAEQDGGDDGPTKVGGHIRDPQNMLRVLDPDPNSRERWERKKVIQMIRKGGRLSKQQVIKRTEREHLLRSHNLKTSVKKLGMLARQIAGKTIDDAITQMRFSKKKIAQDVLKQLEFARDEAVVTRGMGLGSAAPAEGASNLNETSPAVSGTVPVAPMLAKGSTGTAAPMQIQLKDGKRHKVADPSTIYVDQAWVGRGPFGQLPDYRARGKVNIMRTPWTSLTLLLKEEATRVREYEEREEKRKADKLGKGLWMPLPDRPVQWQRQWYCF